MALARRVRNRENVSAPYRRRLRFEPLEDRRMLSITVNTLADSFDVNDGVTSLREAIFAANTVPGADTIDFAPSLTASGPATILLTQGELKITDSLTIHGPGANLLTVDASGNDPTPDANNGDGSRVFDFDDSNAGTQLAMAISDLKITGGDVADVGGGILCRESLTATDLIVTNNAAGVGGGIALAGSPSSVRSSIISGNFASGHAGGMCISAVSSSTTTIISDSQILNNSAFGNAGGLEVDATGANVTINGCMIVGNGSGGYGGGVCSGEVFFDHTTLSILDCVVANNTAAFSGGGVYCGSQSVASNLQGSTLIVDQCKVDGNSAGFSGGGVLSQATSSVFNCLITNNSAGSNGGGISTGINTGQTATITDCTIANNFAAKDGGGCQLDQFNGGQTLISNVTIESNRAAGNGGGVRVDIGVVRMAHVTIVSNQAGATNVGSHQGGGIYGTGVELADTIVADNTDNSGIGPDMKIQSSAVYSLIGDKTGSDFAEAPVGSPDINGNLIGGPVHGLIDPKLGPLVYNGGTVFLDGSRMLTRVILPGSPAIDSGTTGPIALYEFEEGSSGGVAVDGEQNFNGTYHGNPTLGQPSVAAQYGNAALFDGVDDYVEIPRSVANYFSISLWVKTTQTGVGVQQWSDGIGLVDGSVNGVANDFGLSLLGTKFAFGVGNPDTTVRMDNSFDFIRVIQDGNWHLLTATRAPYFFNASLGSTMSVYVDGIFRGSVLTGPNGAKDASTALHIGELQTGGHQYAGLMDEVAIYDRPLSPAEVAELYASGSPANDERGTPWARVVGGRIDMGAVEAQANPLPGDYNFNGVVDTADYSVWRDTLNATNDLRADGDGNGTVDAGDYGVWTSHFGQTLPGAGSGSAAA